MGDTHWTGFDPQEPFGPRRHDGQLPVVQQSSVYGSRAASAVKVLPDSVEVLNIFHTAFFVSQFAGLWAP